MRRTVSLLITIFLSFFLFSCNDEQAEIDIIIPSEVLSTDVNFVTSLEFNLSDLIYDFFLNNDVETIIKEDGYYIVVHSPVEETGNYYISKISQDEKFWSYGPYKKITINSSDEAGYDVSIMLYWDINIEEVISGVLPNGEDYTINIDMGSSYWLDEILTPEGLETFVRVYTRSIFSYPVIKHYSESHYIYNETIINETTSDFFTNIVKVNREYSEVIYTFEGTVKEILLTSEGNYYILHNSPDLYPEITLISPDGDVLFTKVFTEYTERITMMTTGYFVEYSNSLLVIYDFSFNEITRYSGLSITMKTKGEIIEEEDGIIVIYDKFISDRYVKMFYSGESIYDYNYIPLEDESDGDIPISFNPIVYFENEDIIGYTRNEENTQLLQRKSKSDDVLWTIELSFDIEDFFYTDTLHFYNENSYYRYSFDGLLLNEKDINCTTISPTQDGFYLCIIDQKSVAKLDDSMNTIWESMDLGIVFDFLETKEGNYMISYNQTYENDGFIFTRNFALISKDGDIISQGGNPQEVHYKFPLNSIFYIEDQINAFFYDNINSKNLLCEIDEQGLITNSREIIFILDEEGYTVYAVLEDHKLVLIHIPLTISDSLNTLQNE